jgi:hypothetical protein
VIWETHNYICAERLQPNLVAMAEQLAAHGELRLTPRLQGQLERISVSTVQRILRRIGQDMPRRRRRTSTTASARSQIPIRRIPWDTPLPGRFEVDLVHFCGPQTSGEYVYVLVMVDVASAWCEMAAMLGRSYLVMQDAFDRCLQRIPFPVLEIHTDNGSEFFTDHLFRYWARRVKGLERTRNRPYRKNDARFVEHRNGALVRSWLGSARLDTAQQTLALNDFLGSLWLYFNFFQPVMRLREKTWDGKHLRRKYHPAATPLHRVLASGLLSPQHRQQLLSLRRETNPRQLRRLLERDRNAIFRLPPAQAGRSEDVRLTLLHYPTERRWASE